MTYDNIPGNHTSWWDNLKTDDQVTVHDTHLASVEHTIRGRIASIKHLPDAQDQADGPYKQIGIGDAICQYQVIIPRRFNPKRAHITNLRRPRTNES